MRPARFTLRAVGCGLAASAGSFATSSAYAWQSMMDAHGEGQSRASAWVFPNAPPDQPNFDIPLHPSPSLALGPNLTVGDPRTHVLVQGSGNMNWQLNSEIEAASGDTIDWHSMLPYINASSSDARGSMSITGTILTPTSALFSVTWSATDPGVAMHIGWFEGATELFETPVMIGPFSETDHYVINSTGPIDNVMLETSGGAASLVPGPGSLAVIGLAGLVGAAEAVRLGLSGWVAGCGTRRLWACCRGIHRR